MSDEYTPQQRLTEVNKAIQAVLLGGQSYKLDSRTEAKPDPDPAFTPEENWITQNENWLGG